MNVLTSAQYAIPFSRYNDAKVLVANVAQTFTVPSGAVKMILNTSPYVDLWVDDQKAAVIPTGTISNGSAPELNPGMRMVEPGQSVSVISAYAAIVVATYYSR